MKYWPILLVCAASVCIAGAPTIPHFTPGGIGGLVRANYGSIATGVDPNNREAIQVPTPGDVYVLPLMERFNESPGTFLKHDDNTVEVTVSGLYRITLMEDWTAQAGTDIGLRKIMIARVPVGGALVGKVDHGLFDIWNHPEAYKILAAADIPASPTGPSTDAWHTLSTPTVQIDAGERLFATFKSLTTGDYLQITDLTFIQLELIARSTVQPSN